MMNRRHFELLASVSLLLSVSGCNLADCVAMPCPLPTAVVAAVTNSAGGPLAGSFVDVVAPYTARVTCDATTGRCVVPGSAGSYTLRFGATGYQTVERRVSVAEVRATGDCGCDGVTTQQLSLMLAPL